MEIKGDRSGFTVICCDNGHIFPSMEQNFYYPPDPTPRPRSNNDGNWITLLPAKNSISLLHYIANKTFFHAFFCFFHFFFFFLSFFYRKIRSTSTVFCHFLLYIYIYFSFFHCYFIILINKMISILNKNFGTFMWLH